MSQCACMSPNCPYGRHEVDLRCQEPATMQIVSRDWDEPTVEMCRTCALDALVSGLFKRAGRAA